MFIYNSIEWAKCGHCGVEWNGFDYYNLGILMTSHNLAHIAKCPKCGKRNDVKARKELKFSAVKLKDPETPKDKDNG